MRRIPPVLLAVAALAAACSAASPHERSATLEPERLPTSALSTPPTVLATSAAHALDPILATERGLASYYSRMFDGRLTASGVLFDLDAMVAAHPSYPFGTLVRVTNLEAQRSVQVRIIDRGPAAEPQSDGVIIDVSRAAARALSLLRDGRARVRLDVLQWGGDGPEAEPRAIATSGSGEIDATD
jgi:rare lipoprotein A